MVIVASIIVTFKIAHQAGMNIGISVSFWSIGPFLVAIAEKVCYNVNLTLS